MDGPEAIAYMNRYPDVKREYAKYKGAEFVKKVTEHWIKRGIKENRSTQLAERITKLQA